MNYRVKNVNINQTLKYKSNIQEKRNVLLTVKDVSRHKHAMQIDEIQTADASINILTIQVRELQNLTQSKKKTKVSLLTLCSLDSHEAKLVCRPYIKENLLLQVWEEYLQFFPLVLEINDKGTWHCFQVCFRVHEIEFNQMIDNFYKQRKYCDLEGNLRCLEVFI